MVCVRTLQETAKNEGNMEQLSEVQQELDELEETAKEIESKRTKNLSHVRLVFLYCMFNN
jgi:hypothetical protein